MDKKIETYLRQKHQRINRYLKIYLPPSHRYPPVIHQAMRYSVLVGGKRLRPLLVLMTAELLGGNQAKVMPVACALELVHTYSLIHDDLPAMDDDDFRRGKPTCHKKFGEGIAILTGDALLTYAFQLVNNKTKDVRLSNRLIEEISNAIGSEGMIGGQVLDVTHHAYRPQKDQRRGELVNQIYLRKTAALITAAVRIGAIVAHVCPKVLARLTQYGTCLGIAFQIIDDVLDIEGTRTQLGKTPRKDLSQQKLTYPGLFGIRQARQKAADLIHHAKSALNHFGSKAQRLRELADYVINRTS